MDKNIQNTKLHKKNISDKSIFGKVIFSIKFVPKKERQLL